MKAEADNDIYKIVVIDKSMNFALDGYIILNPEESKSGSWEVWSIQPYGMGEDDFDIKEKLIEVYSEELNSVVQLHMICEALRMGQEVGAKHGIAMMQSSTKYALAALTGEVDITELYEAAYQNERWPDKSEQVS